jgi:hypothetical protein
MSRLFKPDADLTEREFASIVADLARQLGWLRYHTYRSERSQPGFPDEVLVRDRVLFVELKREGGRLSPSQELWQRRLRDAGAETYVWRPADLDEIASVLSRRRQSGAGAERGETDVE